MSKETTPHQEGFDAYRQGLMLRDNPYEWASTASSKAWREGWHAGRSAAINEFCSELEAIIDRSPLTQADIDRTAELMQQLGGPEGV